MAKKEINKAKKRAQWAWYLYDFGNSAYAAVVLLAVFSSYFKGEVVGTAEGSALWGLALTISMAVVAVISPIFGAMADYSGRKKTFLLIMTAISTVFTGLLFFVQKGDILLGMVLFIIAEIGYRSGQTFYNGLLSDIADEDELAKVSGNGWAIGSAGGIICLIIVLVMIQLNPGNTFFVRFSLVFTALYFILFSIPAFLWIKEDHRPQDKGGRSYFTVAFDRIKHTLKSVKNFKEFIKFMVALLCDNWRCPLWCQSDRIDHFCDHRPGHQCYWRIHLWLAKRKNWCKKEPGAIINTHDHSCCWHDVHAQQNRLFRRGSPGWVCHGWRTNAQPHDG